ncbi:ribonuclease HII [bacterium]|jgi:ribonuclease HII|nr:ribonuclease HII [bacterium]MBT3903921.1 ribonuclease HII [bacterium]MBT4577707.1 ribonuclease HII [bacterium]MBT5345601.1 ribonuclease HII [bacterium]MBT6130712.1 ribonuclease HII [bacterium]
MSNGKHQGANVHIQKCPEYKDFFEQKIWSDNGFVCGIDEVGRGCLAGPVVACAIILTEKSIPSIIRDSKEISAKKRLEAYNWIMEHCWYGIGVQNHVMVDRYNIYQATMRAMRKAVSHLLVNAARHPDLILVDAMPLVTRSTQAPVIAFCKGETFSSSIAAASIVAKVVRDQLMSRLDTTITGFDMSSNKGYGTQKHRLGLSQQGPSIIHRKTFLKGINEKRTSGQQRFC